MTITSYRVQEQNYLQISEVASAEYQKKKKINK